MADRSENSSARRFHDSRRVLLRGMSERVVRRDEEPCVPTFRDERPGRRVRCGVSVVSPLNVGRRAILVGDARGSRPGDDRYAVFLARNIHHRQRNGRINGIDNYVYTVPIDPLPRPSGCGVLLVTVVGAHQVDRAPSDLGAKILDRKPSSDDRPLPVFSEKGPDMSVRTPIRTTSPEMRSCARSELSVSRRRSIEAMKQKACRGELFLTVAVGSSRHRTNRLAPRRNLPDNPRLVRIVPAPPPVNTSIR